MYLAGFSFSEPGDRSQGFDTATCVYMCVQVLCLLTSVAKVFLIDLDHELSINITKHTTVHPVRHKPK